MCNLHRVRCSLTFLHRALIPHQCFRVGVRLLIHDDLGHLVVTAVGGHVQCRQVVIGDVVHGHVMMQEKLDAVQMVALRGHVERRQTVLEGGEKPVCLETLVGY